MLCAPCFMLLLREQYYSNNFMLYRSTGGSQPGRASRGWDFHPPSCCWLQYSAVSLRLCFAGGCFSLPTCFSWSFACWGDLFVRKVEEVFFLFLRGPLPNSRKPDDSMFWFWNGISFALKEFLLANRIPSTSEVWFAVLCLIFSLNGIMVLKRTTILETFSNFETYETILLHKLN